MDRNKYMNPNNDPAPSGDRGLSNNVTLDVSVNQGFNRTQDYLNRTAGKQIEIIKISFSFSNAGFERVLYS